MNDLELLRLYEPVVAYTEGEMFFPAPVDEYVRQCSLWLRGPEGQEQMLVASNQLTLETLADNGEIPPGHTLFLRFVQEPLEGLAYQRWRLRDDRPQFHAPGRLARVGLASRILDALVDLSYIARGTVPGGTTAAAEVQYQMMRQRDPRYSYYGRVIREGGYILLHYLFFYVMNDWRTTFYGINDHEADWEQIIVYLSDEGDSTPLPRWVAFSQHDFSGDDLRRHWDDPEVDKYDETHPVVYAGAGSHASYFLPGEYLMGTHIEALQPTRNALYEARKMWAERIGQGDNDRFVKRVEAVFTVPFVDYARGDGVRVGPGQHHEWSPILLDNDAQWVHGYRGLWGLDTKDPLGGSRAPAGPKYNRDGTVRLSWLNPLGWAGLHKVAPPRLAAQQLIEHIDEIEDQLRDLNNEIEVLRHEARDLDLELRALQTADYLQILQERHRQTLGEREAALNAMYARRNQLEETLSASRAFLSKIHAGDWGDLQAHVRRKHLPEPPLDNMSHFVEVWSAVSTGALLLVFGISQFLGPQVLVVRALFVIALFIVIETTLRGILANLLLNLTIALAVITTLVLIYQFFTWVVFIGLAAVAWVLIIENVRELRGGR